MSSKRRLTFRAIALLIAISIMQVYILAAPSDTVGTPPDAARPAAMPEATLFGKLSALGAGSVSVNGNEVMSGTTILSGAQIVTPEATGAVITLPSLGRIEIAPKTNLTLTFDRSSINVNVAAGDALLTSNEGVVGSLTAPDGKTTVSDSKPGSSVGTTMYNGGESAPQSSNSNACRIAGMPCALFWVMVGGGAAVVTFFAATRGNNPSPNTP